MPDPPQRIAERRLDLWRRAILLFDKTTQDEGVFHVAGYRNYVLEPKMDNDSNPDLLGASEARFVLCELSVSPNKDFSFLDSYEKAGLTPFLKGLLGVATLESGGAPFFVTTESGFRGFPSEMNALKVYPPFDRVCPSVSDPRLRSALDAWSGFLRPPPNYSLLALPESDLQEIKLPLAGVLRQRASVGGNLTPAEAADWLLGDLGVSFPPSSRKTLERKVSDLVEQAAVYLKGFADFDKARRVLRMTKVGSAAGRKKFGKAISEWLGTRFIEEYVEPEEKFTEEEAEE